MKDSYVKVKAVFLTKTKDAVFLDFEYEKDGFMNEGTWVPFSLMFGPDEKKFGWEYLNEVIEFRIFNWKAKQLGLVKRKDLS